MNSNLEVINSMTEQAEWLERVHIEMGHGKEIVLLLSFVEPSKTNALAKLCNAYHYSQPAHLSSERWEECQSMLDLSDFAAKEHGISLDLIFLLQPQASSVQRPALL